MFLTCHQIGRLQMSGIEAEAMSRRKVLALLGLAAAGVAASAVVLPSDAEAQTAGMQRRQARRAGRQQRRQARRAGRTERRQRRRGAEPAAPASPATPASPPTGAR